MILKSIYLGRTFSCEQCDFKTKSQHYLRSHQRDKHDRINKLSKQGSLDTHVEEGAFADLEEKDDAFDGLLELDDTPEVIGHDDDDHTGEEEVTLCDTITLLDLLFTDWNLLDKQNLTDQIWKTENDKQTKLGSQPA